MLSVISSRVLLESFINISSLTKFMEMEKEKIRELKGANMDIDLATPEDKVHWKQDKCPWNVAENTNKHKCAVKNVSICKYFRGIKVTKENPDIVLCTYPED